MATMPNDEIQAIPRKRKYRPPVTYYLEYKARVFWQWHLSSIAGNGWFTLEIAQDAARERAKKNPRDQHRLLGTDGNYEFVDDLADEKD